MLRVLRPLVLPLLPLCFAGCDSASPWNGGTEPPRPTGAGGAPFDLGPFGGDFGPLQLPLGTEKAWPLTNGTLALTPDGSLAVAADAEGEAVYVALLDGDGEARRVSLPGDAPGRVATSDTTAYVLLRNKGDLVAIDLPSAAVTARVDVCPAPQGLSVTGAAVHVVCRGGELVTLDARTLEEQRRLELDDDLRDVVPRGDGLAVSRFRSAEILLLDAAGEVERRIRPALLDPFTRPAVAWRLLVHADGRRLILAHQTHRNDDVFIGDVGSYGGFCSSVAAPTISIIDPDFEPAAPGEPERWEFPPNRPTPDDPYAHLTRARFSTASAAGVLDVAASQHGLYVVAPGNALTTFAVHDPGFISLRSDSPPEVPSGLAAIFTVSFAEGDLDVCNLGEGRHEPAVPISIAYDRQHARTVVQTRSPAKLRVLGGREIPLHSDDRTNTGFHVFHMNAGAGVACASCHPEGREDGHTWRFALAHSGHTTGPRRTQSLEGGISHLAPFHWDGEFEDLRQFVDDVLVGRMGLGREVSDEHVEHLTGFLDELSPPPAPVLDADAVKRGRDLFAGAATECRNCHGGPFYTDSKLHDVGTGGEFVTPPLTGVWARAPYLHDGCAATLEERFGPCGGGDQHGKTSHLSEQDLSDLVAFLKSL